MMTTEIPPLPKLRHDLDELRIIFEGNALVLNLIAIVEAHRKREACAHEVGEALHLAAQGRHEVPAPIIAIIGERLALGFKKGAA